MIACLQSSSAPKCTAACLQRLFDDPTERRNRLRRYDHPLPPMDLCGAAAGCGSSIISRRPWILAEPQQAAALRSSPAAHAIIFGAQMYSRLPAAALRSSHGAACLQRLFDDPTESRSLLRRYAIIFAAAWACIANSAALNVCACAMANSVRFRQSRINSPKNGYPTCPATAKCCSRC